MQHVFFGSRINSLTLLIMNSLMVQRGLQKEDLASRLVFFGFDGVNTFQGLNMELKFKSNNNVFLCHWCTLYGSLD